MKWGTDEVPEEALMALFRYPLPKPDWTLSVSSGFPVPVSEMMRWMFPHELPHDISDTRSVFCVVLLPFV